MRAVMPVNKTEHGDVPCVPFYFDAGEAVGTVASFELRDVESSVTLAVIGCCIGLPCVVIREQIDRSLVSPVNFDLLWA